MDTMDLLPSEHAGIQSRLHQKTFRPWETITPSESLSKKTKLELPICNISPIPIFNVSPISAESRQFDYTSERALSTSERTSLTSSEMTPWTSSEMTPWTSSERTLSSSSESTSDSDERISPGKTWSPNRLDCTISTGSSSKAFISNDKLKHDRIELMFFDPNTNLNKLPKDAAPESQRDVKVGQTSATNTRQSQISIYTPESREAENDVVAYALNSGKAGLWTMICNTHCVSVKGFPKILYRPSRISNAMLAMIHRQKLDRYCSFLSQNDARFLEAVDGKLELEISDKSLAQNDFVRHRNNVLAKRDKLRKCVDELREQFLEEDQYHQSIWNFV